MLFHVIHTPAFHSLHGRGSVPDTSFDASGMNAATYAWAPTSQYGYSGSSSDWKPACKGAIQAWGATAGQVGQWNPSCRAFDPFYNEYYDLNDSTHNWQSTYETEPGSVDDWLGNVGGGIY